MTPKPKKIEKIGLDKTDKGYLVWRIPNNQPDIDPSTDGIVIAILLLAQQLNQLIEAVNYLLEREKLTE